MLHLSPPGGSAPDLYGGGGGQRHQLLKLRRFLSTLVRFGTDISAPVGDKVREIVFNLVVSQINQSTNQSVNQSIK